MSVIDAKRREELGRDLCQAGLGWLSELSARLAPKWVANVAGTPGSGLEQRSILISFIVLLLLPVFTCVTNWQNLEQNFDLCRMHHQCKNSIQ
jgi:hypothetical protein